MTSRQDEIIQQVRLQMAIGPENPQGWRLASEWYARMIDHDFSPELPTAFKQPARPSKGKPPPLDQTPILAGLCDHSVVSPVITQRLVERVARQTPAPTIRAFTDGSVIEGHAGSGIVLPDLNIELAFPLLAVPATNQRAELHAINVLLTLVYRVTTHSAKWSEELSVIEIYTDSAYAITIIPQLPTWEREGWRTSSGLPVPNHDNQDVVLQIVKLERGNVS